MTDRHIYDILCYSAGWMKRSIRPHRAPYTQNIIGKTLYSRDSSNKSNFLFEAIDGQLSKYGPQFKANYGSTAKIKSCSAMRENLLCLKCLTIGCKLQLRKWMILIWQRSPQRIIPRDHLQLSWLQDRDDAVCDEFTFLIEFASKLIEKIKTKLSLI